MLSTDEKMANLKVSAFGDAMMCLWCCPTVPVWEQRDEVLGYRLAATDEELVAFNAVLASVPDHRPDSPEGSRVRGLLDGDFRGQVKFNDQCCTGHHDIMTVIMFSDLPTLILVAGLVKYGASRHSRRSFSG